MCQTEFVLLKDTELKTDVKIQEHWYQNSSLANQGAEFQTPPVDEPIKRPYQLAVKLLAPPSLMDSRYPVECRASQEAGT